MNRVREFLLSFLLLLSSAYLLFSGVFFHGNSWGTWGGWGVACRLVNVLFPGGVWSSGVWTSYCTYRTTTNHRQSRHGPMKSVHVRGQYRRILLASDTHPCYSTDSSAL
jgi:hypothetical protein